MAGYLVLLYVDEANLATNMPDDLLAAHGKFAAVHGEAIRGGGWLAPTSTATSLRTVGDTPGYAPGAGAEAVDGPFVETKEALAGYYLLEVDDLDAALAVARDVPAPFGGVEVRPLIPTS
jgi:hypothetical protein